MIARAVVTGVAVWGCALVAAQEPAPAAREHIAQEIARLARAEGLDRVAASLDVARRAAEQRRLWLALDELQEAWTYEAARRWASAHAAIKSPEQFSAEWRTNEPAALAAPSRRVPAVVEAIAASNAIRAPATWRASLPYSEDAGMDAGLYYLGEARAFVEFAVFCRSLPFDAAPASPAFASIAADIAALAADVAKRYASATAETRPRFIRINVGLKVARSLDEHGDYGAALYQYLLATYRDQMIAVQAEEGDAAQRLAAARATLPAGRDNSIADLFLERSASLADTKDPQAAKSIAVVTDRVLPAYLRLVQR